MLIYVDIDETICDYDPPHDRDYKKARPIQMNIDKINLLYDQGNEIVYYTARGSLRKHLLFKYEALTREQLQKWGAKHHKLIVGEKPAYDLIICDKARRIEEINP